MAFKYRPPSQEDLDRRANMSTSDFKGFIKDEYRLYVAQKQENHVRIMPPSSLWTDAKYYAMDIWVHYGVGPDRASVLCLDQMKGQKCPICQERARAEKARDEELTRDLRATRRVLCFVVDRKDPGKGVLAWPMPSTVDREIAKAAKDRSTGQYFFVDDPVNGYDVYFDRDGEGLSTKYTGVSLARRSSKVEDKYLDWVEAHPLPEVLKWRSYEEVRRLYEGNSRPDDDEDTEVGFGPADPPEEPEPRRRTAARADRAGSNERAEPRERDAEPDVEDVDEEADEEEGTETRESPAAATKRTATPKREPVTRPSARGRQDNGRDRAAELAAKFAEE
ncbi:MAG: hypothetical protein J2P48_06870 [Alphaproteobacteria bacterium]|nr:hypothetical protein [Alphaproteobacteria bacterium]